MTECETNADDLAQKAQAAAEERLHACWAALQAEEDGEESPAWPETAGPFCGCDTCVIRETLAAAWPLLVEAARAEIGYDVRRLAVEPGDRVLVAMEEKLLPAQASEIATRVRRIFPDNEVLITGAGCTVSIADEDEGPVPANVE